MLLGEFAVRRLGEPLVRDDSAGGVGNAVEIGAVCF
jgi:hypothetical protein